jgi:hypothetical protein
MALVYCEPREGFVGSPQVLSCAPCNSRRLGMSSEATRCPLKYLDRFPPLQAPDLRKRRRGITAIGPA